MLFSNLETKLQLSFHKKNKEETIPFSILRVGSNVKKANHNSIITFPTRTKPTHNKECG